MPGSYKIMDRIIIVLILIILLLASVLAAVYFYLAGVNADKYNQSKIQDLENSGKALREKINNVLGYARALDLILEPSRQQLGLDTKIDTTKTEWLSSLSVATDKTNDLKLQDILKKITDGAPEQAMVPTVQYMDYVVKAILNSLSVK
jgi:hypothetical protein